MKQKWFVLMLLSILVSIRAFPQAKLNALQADPDVGVVERLGNTIPMDLRFTNENNAVVALKDVIKKPTLLTLVYFDCPGVCSPMLDGVSDVIDKTVAQIGKDYQVVTVSFNFKDTPEKALEKKNNFLKNHSKENAKYWTYLTGDSTSIYSLADAVGFKFKRSGNDFIHPAVIMFLSPAGKITRYLYGINFNPAEINTAIADAGAGNVKQSINKILTFCYTYNPQENKYVLSATKIAGISAIFVFLVVGASIVVAIRRRRRELVTSD